MNKFLRRFFLCTILVIALLVRLKGIFNPLLDNQAWRQTDTACIATHMLGHLFNFPDVFFPRLNYDGVIPQKVELEFPFLPYLMACTWTIFGKADLWGRLWAVIFSLLTVYGLYELGKSTFSKRTGLLAAGIYSLSPLAIYYGRVVMPEPVAQAFSVWALVLIRYWRIKFNRKNRSNYLLEHKQGGVPMHYGKIMMAGLVMAGAILAKLPQLMLLPTAMFLGFWPLKKIHWKPLLIYLILALLPPVLYYGWVHFGASSSTQFVSGIITGQVAQAKAIYWKPLIQNVREEISWGLIFLSLAGLCLLIVKKHRESIWIIVWGITASSYILLICSHIPLDYYLVPVLPLIALLSAQALDNIRGIQGTVAGIILLFLLWNSGHSILASKYQWKPGFRSQAEWIAHHTNTQAVLVLSDAPPMTFYYADRVGFRLVDEDDRIAWDELKRLPGNFFVRNPYTQRKPAFWQKVSAAYPEIGPGVYQLR